MNLQDGLINQQAGLITLPLSWVWPQQAVCIIRFTAGSCRLRRSTPGHMMRAVPERAEATGQELFKQKKGPIG
jgi:hypothetical protein